MPQLITSPGIYIEKARCGYCGDEHSSKMFGFDVRQMDCAQYQQLINRGFRRSGKFLYKPDALNSCCAQYSMRLDVAAYRAGKEHRQALNRFNRFVTHAETHQKGKHNHFDLLEATGRGSGPNSDLRIAFETTAYSEEKFDLYKRYQIQIHKEPEDEVTREGFKRFLCNSPLGPGNVREVRDFEDIDECEDIESSDADSSDRPHEVVMEHSFRGSVHQKYYYRDTLLAIGVIDIVDEGVSSVYLIWDPEYPQLGLGKVSSMYEIALAQQLGLPFYYMGFYIHTCPKMHYKSAYSPSFFLDPQFLDFETDGWFPIEGYLAKMEHETYATMSDRVLLPQPELRTDRFTGDLFESGMPGVLSYRELQAECNKTGFDVLDIPLLVASVKEPVYINDLVEVFRVRIKRMCEQLVAAIGLNLAGSLVIDFVPDA